MVVLKTSESNALQRSWHKDKVTKTFMAGHIDRVVCGNLLGVHFLPGFSCVIAVASAMAFIRP
jgi:hypothetical protein